ncbi:Transposase [Caenorhabditis elegans]|uniref:Transposase n=1 Tax=Caenorhabditis elegans TaxID=6239 RepID=D4YW55_CAEEL|nr:Transposase [Caenorhabditis elegans]CCD62031.2 Transposase [Caenorhabditis elegans]|eukprot:NP_001255287.2 Uncharacterized protein CELE_T22D1.18 [Caenorhabditis elegans]
MANIVPIHKSLEYSLVDVPLLCKNDDPNDEIVIYSKYSNSRRFIDWALVITVAITACYSLFTLSKFYL